jgi:YegS/Rv2252/BmrU family lipid kinase
MTAPQAWLAIVNPTSGGSRSAAEWPQVAAALQNSGMALDTVLTAAPGDGNTIARRAVIEGRRRILAVGGDGSINDILNGIMTLPRPPDDLVTLATVPLGTGNDWARALGMPREPIGIAAAIAAGRTMLHDVGLLEFTPDASGRPRRHWFMNVAGAGFDSHVIERLPSQVDSRIAYLRGALKELANYELPHFRLTADADSLDERLLLTFVANGQYCGNRMHVAPRARLDDGLLDVVAIREVGLLKALVKLAKLYRGTLSGDRLVWETQTARLRIETREPAAVQADGQVVGSTPVDISVVPSALRAVIGPPASA